MAIATGTALALGGAQLLGGLIGANQQRQAAAGAQAALDRARAGIAGVELPDIEKMKLALENPAVVGQYGPLLEQLYQLGPSAMEGVATDPRLAQAQMQALEQISGYAKGEMTPADMAALDQIRRSTASQGQARQQAILSEMQQRGQGGSGAELIARLKAGQSEADRASQEGAALQQMLQQRALQAITNQAQLGGSIRSQEFGEKSDIARAKDVINQFNLQNKQSTQARNISEQNRAQMLNLAERQRIADQSVALRNQQQQYNKQLAQQQFANQMSRAQGMAGQETQLANYLTGKGAQEAQGITNAIGGITNMGLAASLYGKPSVPMKPGDSLVAQPMQTEGDYLEDASYSPFQRT